MKGTVDRIEETFAVCEMDGRIMQNIPLSAFTEQPKDGDIFDFENVDFNRFSFSVNDAPQVVPFSPGLRRYITVQVIVENNAVNEGFGIFGIVRRYRTAGFFKR